MLGQLHIGGGLNVDAGAGGDVVEDNGLGGNVADGVVHGNQTLLGGLVVVGGDAQHTVAADGAGELRQLDGVGGVVGAGTGDDGHPARRRLHGALEGVPVLLIGQGGAFAGGAADDQSVDALVNLPVDELFEGGKIDAVLVGGGDEGRGYAAENGFMLHDRNSFIVSNGLEKIK